MKYFAMLSFFLAAQVGFAEELISIRSDMIIEIGALTPRGCIIATPYKGNLGDLLGNDLVQIKLVESGNESISGFYEKIAVTPFGNINFQIHAGRNRNNGNLLSLSGFILKDGKKLSAFAFHFNKKNELVFPFTQINAYLGKNNQNCYRANLVVTPFNY